MSSNRMRQAEYPLVGLALHGSLEENLPQFSLHYKNMDAQYLTDFKSAITDVQEVHASTTGLPEQKDLTSLVEEKQEQMMRKMGFLRDYANLADLDEAPAKAAEKELRRGDTEEGVKAVNRAVAFYTPHMEKMTSFMSEDFLTTVTTEVNELETLNVEQNKAINFRSNLTEENRAKYDTLDEYIRTVSRLGKRLFRGTAKADEFTVSKILTRIRVAPRKEKEGEEEE